MSILLEVLARGAVLCALVLVLGAIPWTRRLASQGTLSSVALAWLLAMPVLLPVAPHLVVPILPSSNKPPTILAASTRSVSSERPAPVATAAPTRVQSSNRGDEVIAPRSRLISVVLAVYGCLSIAILFASLVARWRVRVLVRRARRTVPSRLARAANKAADLLGIGVPPLLRVSRDVGLPFVAGTINPVIVFPSAARQWSDDRLRAVMLHEMAHVRRQDGVQRLLADVACALHWANPLVWIVASRLRAHAELACDRAVVTAGIDAQAYAQELLHLARSHRRVPMLSPAIGVTGAAVLRTRIESLLGPSSLPGHRQRVFSWMVAVLAGTMCAVIVPTPGSAQGRGVASLNVSDSGPDASSNQAGLQARWSENGRHSALFLTGSVDLNEAAEGRLGGKGQLLVVTERSRGLRVFEWHTGMSTYVPPDVRATLVVGSRQLARLTGRHERGLPGSTLTGLPAWSDDPSAHVIQAGWLRGNARIGIVLRGHWHVEEGALVPSEQGAWMVLFSFDQKTSQLRRIELTPGSQGRLDVSFAIDGVDSPSDDRALAWATELFQTLQRNAPDGIDLEAGVEADRR